MSRSNNPQPPPGGWPPPGWTQEQEGEGQPIGFPLSRQPAQSPPRQRQGHAPPRGYSPPPQFDPAPPGGYAPQYAADPGARPPAFEDQPRASRHPQAPRAAGGGYYGSPQQAAGQPAPTILGGRSRGYGDQAPPQLSMPAAPNSAPQRAQQTPPWPSAAPASGQRAFDLGAYAPAGQDAARGNASLSGQPAGKWPSREPYAPAATDDLGYASFGSQAQFDSGYGQAEGYEQNADGGGLDGFPREQAVYDDEEPRRRGGPILVVAALVGAIAVGGGLAYAYRTLIAPESTGATPVVKGDSVPARAKPAEIGGKQFAFTGSKIMGQLNDGAETAPEAGAEPGASAETEASGARKVPVFAVDRDGAIVPPQPESEPSPPVSGVPGLSIDTGGFGPLPRARRAEPPAPARAQPTVTSALPEQGPVVVTPPPAATRKPTVLSKAPEPEETAPAEEAPPAAAAPPPPKLQRAPAPPKRAAAEAAPAPADAASGANGYVAVLASVPVSANSRIDALKKFADLQQKYATALQNKTPDVREANLGEKGNYHRLLVGPPGSREQASSVCGELKSAGYTGCWVTAY